MDCLRKSFKSNESHKNMEKLSEASGGGGNDSQNTTEELPILSIHRTNQDGHNLHHTHSHSCSSPPLFRAPTLNNSDFNNINNNEVIVRVDDSSNINEDDSFSDTTSSCSSCSNSVNCLRNMHTEPSFGFLHPQVMENPPAANGANISFKSFSLSNSNRNINNNTSFSISRRWSKEIQVSFEPSSVSGGNESATESFRRRHKDSFGGNNDGFAENASLSQQQQPPQPQIRDEVVTCSATSSFRKEANNILGKPKVTRSRLLDPSPDEIERMIPRSGQLRSGLLSKVTDEEDDDLLEVEDVPDEYKKRKVNFLTIIQWVSLVLIIASLVSTVLFSVLGEQKIAKIQLWKWECMLLVLTCGRLVSGWVIRMIVFFIERNFFMRKRVLYFVYGLRKGVQNCVWLGLVLLVWHYLFDKKMESEKNSGLLKYLTKILVCFLVANFIWLIKTLAVKVLASCYHVSTYFDRIQESVFNQYIIETLSGPPLIEIQKNEEELAKTEEAVRQLQNAGATLPPDLKAAVFPPSLLGRIHMSSGVLPQRSFRATRSFRFSRQLSAKGDKKSNSRDRDGDRHRDRGRGGSDDYITIESLHKLNPKNVSAWNMKRLMNIVRHGSLSTLDEQILGTTSTICEDDSARQIRSEFEAKLAARKIFYNVARPGSKHIYFDDLMRFMREDEAIMTINCINEGKSDATKICRKPLKNWVVKAFRERRALALTLNDTKTVVKQLHHMINITVGVVIVIIWLLILGIASSRFFLFIGSQIFLASFIFGNTCRTLFESIIFLFFIHPFDVGDRCEIDGTRMVVEEMNILTTVFLKEDNLKVVFPNSVLATKPISNFYRSPDMGDEVEFLIQIATPAEKIVLMKQRVISYVENKKEHWYPEAMVVVMGVEDLNMVKMSVWLRHKSNFQDIEQKFLRRHALIEELIKIFKDLEIQYILTPLDINILTVPPAHLNSS